MSLSEEPKLQDLTLEDIPWKQIDKYMQAIVIPPYSNCSKDWWCRSNYHIAVAADHLGESRAFIYALSHLCPGFFPQVKSNESAVKFLR